jgi:hypothetical protein
VRKLVITTIIFILGAQLLAAQDGSTSTVNIFYVTCENQGVINFDGTMDPGFDIYYQLFSAAGGGGQALTSLRRVQVDGNYAVSDQLAYNSGQTVPSGSIGSARVVMAREGNPASTIFETTVDDLQDGCANPQNTLASSLDAGDPTVDTAPTGTIRSPYGDFLTLENAPQPIVVIGAPAQLGRSNKPGEIFAECDQYLPEADPGVVYDTDTIVIFWSWFARTPAQVQDHIDKAIYEVKFQTAPLLNLQVSPIEQRGTNHWVFYTARIGNLAPGTYGVEFKLSWEEETFDGYDTYGPGSDNESFQSTCTFEVKRDPFVDQQGINFNQIYSIR